jgi:hypothetical protein
VDFLSVAVTKVSFVNLRKSELFPTPYSPHSITFCSGILIVAIVDSTAKTTQPPAPKVTQQNNKSHSSETVLVRHLIDPNGGDGKSNRFPPNEHEKSTLRLELHNYTRNGRLHMLSVPDYCGSSSSPDSR